MTGSAHHRPRGTAAAISLLAAGVAAGFPGATVRAAEQERPHADAPPESSLMAPQSPRSMGRVAAEVRPFINLLGSGWGLLGGVTVEVQPWALPLKLTAGVTPVVLSMDGRANPSVLHARLGAGFTSRFLGLDLSAGTRVQDFGAGGFSFAAGSRMGAVDGLTGRVDLTYLVARNYYTGETVFAFSNLLTSLEIPVHPAVALVVEGGVGLDAWLFATIGLKHHLGPRGVPGTWAVRGGLGIVWTHDECLYMDPRPCEGWTWAAGPTVTAGVERRF